MAAVKKLPPAETQNGARILSLLHTSGVDTWEALCGMFQNAKPDNIKTNTISRTLYYHLAELKRLGLVEYEANIRAGGPIKGKIQITMRWADIQKALGRQPLAAIADISSMSGGMAVAPVFGRVEEPNEKIDIFVLMPFKAKLGNIYTKHLKKLGDELGLAVRRADDIYSPRPFMGKVWDGICAARLVLADCTEKNANVFYEIGMAHTVGKKVVLITRSDKDIPSDIKHFDYLHYVYDPEGVETLVEKLRTFIKGHFSL